MFGVQFRNVSGKEVKTRELVRGYRSMLPVGNRHNPEWTKSQVGQNPERTKSQIEQSLKWTKFRID